MAEKKSYQESQREGSDDFEMDSPLDSSVSDYYYPQSTASSVIYTSTEPSSSSQETQETPFKGLPHYRELPAADAQRAFEEYKEAAETTARVSNQECKTRVDAAKLISPLFQGAHKGPGTVSKTVKRNLPWFLPIFKPVFNAALSKAMVYPPMKELVMMYPAWLEMNKGKIPANNYMRYKKQLTLIVIICKEYELQSEFDSEEITQIKYQKILTHLVKLHCYGSPPEDLLKNMTMFRDGDQSNSVGYKTADQCIII